jgi:hypothetical protein
MASTRMSTSAAASTANTKTVLDAKIQEDLETVKEKIDLCTAMLNPGADDPNYSIKSNDAMLAIVGFLEACTPRMVELIEVASTGILSEDIFAECLSVNDLLRKVLAEVETAALTETDASTTTASAPASSVQEQFEDLLLGDDSNSDLKPPAVAGTKSTGEEDDDNDDDDDAKQPGIQPSRSADEFDAFFTERTTPS